MDIYGTRGHYSIYTQGGFRFNGFRLRAVAAEQWRALTHMLTPPLPLHSSTYSRVDMLKKTSYTIFFTLRVAVPSSHTA